MPSSRTPARRAPRGAPEPGPAAEPAPHPQPDGRDPASAAQRALATISLRALEIFVAVAEESSMSAAAVRLGMSQAAVSQAVISLEDSLGVQLFDRSTRPPLLTLPGRMVLQHALDITSRVHRLADFARFGGSGAVPLLRLGMLNSLAVTIGATLMRELMDVALEWTVVSGFEAAGIRALLERRSDVVVTADETSPPPGIAAFPVCSEPFVLALPASFRHRVGSMHELAKRLEFVRYGHATHMGPMIRAYLDSLAVPVPQRYQFDTTDAALNMVAGGFGWTIVSPVILLKSVDMLEAIRVVPVPQAALRRTIAVAVRADEGVPIGRRVQAAAVKALRDSAMPRIEALLPRFAREIDIHSDSDDRTLR